MYAVIRTGGKQYRVAPGDVVRVERVAPAEDGTVQFQALAVSASEGQIASGANTQVTGQVVEEGRGNKILVFHYKRKKQYKKLQGHRQDFSAVRITEITVDGQRFSAPELPARKPKKQKPVETEAAAASAAPKKKAKAKATKAAKPKAKAKPAAKAAKKATPKKK